MTTVDNVVFGVLGTRREFGRLGFFLAILDGCMEASDVLSQGNI